MLKYALTIFFILSWFILPAQLQVRDEPRHHNVFENEFIRILDVHLAPKDTTLYHLHNTPSVFIVLANTNTGSQLAGQQPQKGASLTGLITYDALATPRFHRVWNEDTSWFQVMDIELTASKPKNKVELLKDDKLKPLFNEPLVTGYKIQAGNAQKIKLPSSASGYLLVSLGNALVDINLNELVQHRIMKAGHYVWLDGKEAATITSNSITDFVLLQLK